MAKPIYDLGEIVQNDQILDGIRRTLETANVASIKQSVIESSYDLEDEAGEPVDGNLEDKCRRIADWGNWDYSLCDDLAFFRRKRKTH